MWLELITSINQPLLDCASRNLHVEIVRETLEDLVQTEKDWLQCGKLAGCLDLLVKPVEFLLRIDVFQAHAAMVHVPESRPQCGSSHTQWGREISNTERCPGGRLRAFGPAWPILKC